MSCAQYPDSFFFTVQNRWISCVHYPDKIYFISVTKIKALIYDVVVKCNSTQLRMEIFFSLRLTWFRAHGLDRNSRDYISYYNRKRRSWNSHTVLFPVVTARMGLQRSEKCHKLKGLRDVKEGGTCIELEKQAYCGDWEWRNQHCRSD